MQLLFPKSLPPVSFAKAIIYDIAEFGYSFRKKIRDVSRETSLIFWY